MCAQYLSLVSRWNLHSHAKKKKEFHYNVTTQSVFSQYFYSTRERQEGPFHLGGFLEPWSHSKCYFLEAELQNSVLV